MSKRLTLEQKKKRQHQLRDAQRRRRAKLKQASQRFVQIIIPGALLDQLRQISTETGETVQELIARMVADAVPQMIPTPPPAKAVETADYPEPEPEIGAPAAEMKEMTAEPKPPDEPPALEIEPPPPVLAELAEAKTPPVPARAGQLDLFG